MEVLVIVGAAFLTPLIIFKCVLCVVLSQFVIVTVRTLERLPGTAATQICGFTL